jgi:hypothetical protein
VWAVADGETILRFDGTSWSRVETDYTGILYSLWGAHASDIWAVGQQNAAHYDGTQWTVHPMEAGLNLTDMWGTAGDDIWAVGTNGAADGVIMHYDGIQWSLHYTLTGIGLGGVHGTGPDDVWAAGWYNFVLHWDGNDWSMESASNLETMSFGAVFAAGPNDVWAAEEYQDGLAHFDGNVWTAVELTDEYGITGFAGTGPDDIYASTRAGNVLHYTGQSWEYLTPTAPSGPGLGTIMLLGDFLWVAGTNGAVLTRSLD